MRLGTLHLQSLRIRSWKRLSRNSWSFWGLVCSALIIRIGFVLFVSPSLDVGQTLSVDASSYHQIAQNLVDHHIFTSSVDPPYDPNLPSTFRPPLTPFYLAAIYTVFGVNLQWGRLGLAIIGAFSCGLTYVLGAKLFGRTTGLVAGIISCGYPFFLLLVHLPLTEGLSLFLLLILMTLLYEYNPQSENKDWGDNLRSHDSICLLAQLSLIHI